MYFFGGKLLRCAYGAGQTLYHLTNLIPFAGAEFDWLSFSTFHFWRDNLTEISSRNDYQLYVLDGWVMISLQFEQLQRKP